MKLLTVNKSLFIVNQLFSINFNKSINHYFNAILYGLCYKSDGMNINILMDN